MAGKSHRRIGAFGATLARHMLYKSMAVRLHKAHDFDVSPEKALKH